VVSEVGLPQLTTTVWFGLTGPKDLPLSIVKQLTAAHKQITSAPEFNTRMTNAGMTVSHNLCGVTFASKIDEETLRWSRIVKATGFVAGN
jgi:tripartite-type tricarboxylate transporter receptor subunit TctC